MKRIIPILLCLLLVLPCLLVPALAAEITDISQIADSVQPIYIFEPMEDNDEFFSGPYIPEGNYLACIMSDRGAVRLPLEVPVSYVPSDGELTGMDLCILDFVLFEGAFTAELLTNGELSFLSCDLMAGFDGFALVPVYDTYRSLGFVEDVFILDAYVASGTYVLEGSVGDSPFVSEPFELNFEQIDDSNEMITGIGCVTGVFLSFPDFPSQSEIDLDLYIVDLYYGLCGLGLLGDIYLEPGHPLLHLEDAEFTLRRVDPSLSISTVMTGVDTFSGLLGGLFDLITGNPLFSALFGGALVMVCIPLYIELKKSAK